MSTLSDGSAEPRRRPEAIVAVPVRHPGRWVAAAIIAACSPPSWCNCVDHQPPASSGGSSATTCSATSILHGRPGHHRADDHRHGRSGIVLGRRPGGDAAVAEPDRVGRGVGLHLVLPGHAGAGAAVLLDSIAARLPVDLARASRSAPAGCSRDDPKTLITQFVAALPRARPQRGRLHGRDRPRPASSSVDEGQVEAASALGMTRLQTMRRIVLPQAMRVIIPPTGNETISMLKTTSLAFVHRLHRAALPVADHLRPQLPDDPAADRGQHLVPVHDLGPARSARTTSSVASPAAPARELPPTPFQQLRAGSPAQPA